MIRCTAILFMLALYLADSPARAQDKWTVVPLEDDTAYLEATAETRAPAPSGIADMLTATGPEGSDIAAAWYGQPTSRYRHGILGDRVEGGMLFVRLENGREIRYRLSESRVFEDIAPRIADLDGDGRSEVVTILSSISAGASVTVFGMTGNALAVKGTTGFIGQANRWLNIAGISNFTGNRTPEIAIVATPHVGGTLGIFKYLPGTLFQFAGANGFSNHVIGSSELRLSALADVNEDGRADLALPSADRRTLVIIGFSGRNLIRLGEADLPSPIDKAIGVTGRGKDAVFLIGTEDGKHYSVSN